MRISYSPSSMKGSANFFNPSSLLFLFKVGEFLASTDFSYFYTILDSFFLDELVGGKVNQLLIPIKGLLQNEERSKPKNFNEENLRGECRN
jgi:hypothetical protein